jgi:putative ABC transport system permease protein
MRAGADGNAFVISQSELLDKIAYVFPVFFIIVAALVVYMTITRLVDVERGQIGCLKTLGYSKFHIIFRYLIFVFVASAVGCVLGIIVGQYFVSEVLYRSVVGYFAAPEVKSPFPWVGVWYSVAMIIFVLGITILSVFLAARERAENLFKGKAPKHGKKILLERIPFLWKILKFRYKSTFRNIFRYKVRFVMTVFSMAFSTALVFCGLALAFAMRESNPEMNDSIGVIATVVVVAAVLLNTLVVYNITNINISERKREIATLRVLGYRNGEVAGYIFREIVILATIGLVIGLPAGYGFMAWVFDFLNFSGIGYVSWWVWFVAGGAALGSLGFAFVMVLRKMFKIDMNGSLKTID